LADFSSSSCLIIDFKQLRWSPLTLVAIKGLFRIFALCQNAKLSSVFFECEWVCWKLNFFNFDCFDWWRWIISSWTRRSNDNGAPSFQRKLRRGTRSTKTEQTNLQLVTFWGRGPCRISAVILSNKFWHCKFCSGGLCKISTNLPRCYPDLVRGVIVSCQWRIIYTYPCSEMDVATNEKNALEKFSRKSAPLKMEQSQFHTGGSLESFFCFFCCLGCV
jgi:hypothetical protein